MKGKQLRTFMADGKEMSFNVRYFQEMFMKLARKENKGIVNYEYEIADALFVDRTTIHNWRMNVNGPGDIEKIQSLASFWNIEYRCLLMEAKSMKTVETEKKQILTESEKHALRNVYRAFLNYMEAFDETTGFIWNQDGSDYDIRNAYVLYDKLKYGLKYEYIDLKRTVYDELEQFVNGTLSASLEGSFNPEEETTEQVIGAANEQYECWMNEFKTIVDSYLVE